MLFFNPGKKIPGIPFIGNKIALFDDEVAKRYDFAHRYGCLQRRNVLCIYAVNRGPTYRVMKKIRS